MDKKLTPAQCEALAKGREALKKKREKSKKRKPKKKGKKVFYKRSDQQ